MSNKKYYYTVEIWNGKWVMVVPDLPDTIETTFFSELHVGDWFYVLNEPNRVYEKIENTVLKDGYVADSRNVKTGKYTHNGGYLIDDVQVVIVRKEVNNNGYI